MSGAWGRMAGGPTGRWAVWKFNWLANHKILRALEHAREHARGDLLDIGCGSKPFAPVFEGRLRRYWGTDLTASRYLGGARLDAFASAEAQPFRDASFDTVLGLSMITYLPEPLRFLREAHRVLRPGGMLLLECTQMVPLHDEPHDYFRHALRRCLSARAGGFRPGRVRSDRGALVARRAHDDRSAQSGESRAHPDPHRAAGAPALHRHPVAGGAHGPRIRRRAGGARAPRDRAPSTLTPPRPPA